MRLKHWATFGVASSVVTTAVACWGDKNGEPSEHDCSNAWEDGYRDAEASNPSCTECNYEDYWAVDRYEGEYLKDCYANGYWYLYETSCFMFCPTVEEDPGVCCSDAMNWTLDQMVALGIWWDWRESE